MLKLFMVFILFLVAMSMGRTEVNVNYIELHNFSTEEYIKIHKTAKVIEKILNSQEFKDRVLHHTYKNKLHYIDTELSNEDVYATILKGSELAYKPEPDGNMDIGLEMYYSESNTIGYTLPKSDMIWLNRKYHDEYDEYTQSANLVHEWLHKLGFDHAKRWSESRDHSVPYAIGSIVTELAKILKDNPRSLRPVNSAFINLSLK